MYASNLERHKVVGLLVLNNYQGLLFEFSYFMSREIIWN